MPTPDLASLADAPTPSLILDRGRLAANCRRMIDRCASLGVGLRPHMKTLKSIDADLSRAVVRALEPVVSRVPKRPAELVSYGMVAGPDPSLLTQPSRAIVRALDKVGKQVGDLDLIEINEAFAAVALASMRELGIDDTNVNVNGGAIALGHPIGASGARVVLTLVDELRRRGAELGAASLCGGGGQGEATIVRAL